MPIHSEKEQLKILSEANPTMQMFFKKIFQPTEDMFEFSTLGLHKPSKTNLTQEFMQKHFEQGGKIKFINYESDPIVFEKSPLLVATEHMGHGISLIKEAMLARIEVSPYPINLKNIKSRSPKLEPHIPKGKKGPQFRAMGKRKDKVFF